MTPDEPLSLCRYDFYREDFPLREQIIGSKYAGPLLAQSLVSSRKSHFNLKFVSQLVLKVRKLHSSYAIAPPFRTVAV